MRNGADSDSHDMISCGVLWGWKAWFVYRSVGLLAREDRLMVTDRREVE
jgi:hypothetical protein